MQLSLMLREHTKDAHNGAEASNFQRLLGNADLELVEYRRYLEQLYLVHNALERALSANTATRAVASEEQFQTEHLRRDIEALGGATDNITPLSSTKYMLQKISDYSESAPLNLLGSHYVLLGSKHGGKMIAAQWQKKHHLPNGGATYMDPYGGTFMPLWMSFKTALDGTSVSDAQAEEIVRSAREMFEYVGKLGAELMSLPKQA